MAHQTSKNGKNKQLQSELLNTSDKLLLRRQLFFGYIFIQSETFLKMIDLK